MSHDYQAIVIGAGPGGYPCAIRLGQQGIKTLIIESSTKRITINITHMYV